MHAQHRPGKQEEVLHHLGHQPALLRFGGLPDDGREIEGAFGQSFERRVRDLAEPLAVDLLDDPALDDILGEIPRVHLAKHSFNLICGEDVAKDIEDLAGLLGVQVGLDALEPLEELVQNAPFARVRGDEVEDEAVLLLQVPVDAPHPLFQAHRIPGNVVVDHEPAELEVDAFARRLRCRHDLAAFTELALRIDAATGSVAVADLHAAMNLRYGEVPFVPHLLDEVIERVLVLRENQKLHLRIVEDALLRQHFPKFPELGFDFALFEQKSLRDKVIQLSDLVFQRDWIYRDDGVFERGHDFLLLFFREIIEIVGNARVDLLLTVCRGITQYPLPLVPHSLQASPGGPDAGGESALQHGHREPNGAAARGVVGRRLDGLVLDVTSERIVEFPLFVVDSKADGLDLSLCEESSDLAGLRVREVDKGLLYAAQVKRSLVPDEWPRRCLQRPHRHPGREVAETGGSSPGRPCAALRS